MSIELVEVAAHGSGESGLVVCYPNSLCYVVKLLNYNDDWYGPLMVKVLMCYSCEGIMGITLCIMLLSCCDLVK